MDIESTHFKGKQYLDFSQNRAAIEMSRGLRYLRYVYDFKAKKSYGAIKGCPTTAVPEEEITTRCVPAGAKQGALDIGAGTEEVRFNKGEAEILQKWGCVRSCKGKEGDRIDVVKYMKVTYPRNPKKNFETTFSNFKFRAESSKLNKPDGCL